MPVLFHTQDVSFKLSRKKQLKIWLGAVVASEGKKTGIVNIVLCSDNYLLTLNQTYLNHDTLTDIITFPYNNPDDATISGDIYISTERVGENARIFGVTPENELLRVMAHGVLHLLGYKDKTKAQKAEMRAAEDKCLRLWEGL